MTAAPATPEPVRRRRRAWPWVLLVVGVLLVAAGFAADALVRGLAERAIAEQVSSALDVPPGTEVTASIGGGPVLVQAIAGQLERVDVDVPALTLGPLTGDLAILAQDVPFDTAAPTRALTVQYAVAADALAAVAPDVAGFAVDSVTIDGGELVATGSISVFDAALPLGIGLTPSAIDGELAFDPTSIRIGDGTLTAAQLRADPVLGGLADALLQQRRVCIADALPAALRLDRLAVEGRNLVATFDGSDVAIAGDGFREKGVCPA